MMRTPDWRAAAMTAATRGASCWTRWAARAEVWESQKSQRMRADSEVCHEVGERTTGWPWGVAGRFWVGKERVESAAGAGVERASREASRKARRLRRRRRGMVGKGIEGRVSGTGVRGAGRKCGREGRRWMRAWFPLAFGDGWFKDGG